MTRKKHPNSDRMLTEVELELMRIIWGLRECTVKEVVDALPSDRNLAYTSVATIMKILEGKKVLASRKAEKAHVYHPLLTKDEYESTSLKHIADNLFQGDPSSMVMKLLNDSKMTREELQAIRKVLKDRLDA